MKIKMRLATQSLISTQVANGGGAPVVELLLCPQSGFCLNFPYFMFYFQSFGKIHFVNTKEAQLPEPPPHWPLELKSGTELPPAF